MIDINEPISIHFEITDKCNARCPQCSRNKKDLVTEEIIERPNLLNKDMKISEYKAIFDNFTGKLNKILFCGNYGDPIAARDIYEIVDYTIFLQPNSIQINTNGSLKTEQWWKKFGNLLSSTPHICIFSIDGLEDTHSIYRLNTSYEKIVRNARAFMEGGGNAEWSFIIFKHNEHQIEEAKRRAEQMGFHSFCAVETQRFGTKEEIKFKFKGNDYKLEPATVNKKDVQTTTKNFQKGGLSNIDCISIKRNEIFIDPIGEVYPCCWIGSRDYAQRYFGFNDEDHPIMSMRTSINCIDYALQKCIEDDWFAHIIPLSFEIKPSPTCSRVCGFKLRKKNNRNIIASSR